MASQSFNNLDPRIAQLKRILSSPGFRSTERLSRFLRFIVEETVAGREQFLKESTIGTEVFGKPATFDPKADSTVRSEAVKLRTRLAAYYEADGAGDPWIISVPKGTYVPSFTQRAAEVGDAKAGDVEVLPEIVERSGPSRSLLWKPLSAGIAIACGVGALTVFVATRKPLPAAPQPVRLTWERGLDTTPVVSADGNLLAYASARSGEGHLDLWVRPLAGGAPLRLTNDPADDSEPDFSPAGDQIAFRSDRDGGGIYLVPTLGGNQRLIAGSGRGAKFSPDGLRIAYYTGDPKLFRSTIQSGKAYIVDVSGGEPRRIASNFSVAVHPIWSPDGKRILFLGYPNEDFATIKLDWWIVDADGGKPELAGFAAAVKRQQVCGAVSREARGWQQGRAIFVARCGGAGSLWSIPMSGSRVTGEAQRLTVGSGNESKPSISRAGIVFASENSQSDIWGLAMDAETATVEAGERRLTESDADELFPSVSADGRTMLFVTNRSGTRDIWRKDLITGEEYALVAGPGTQTFPEIAPDGREFVYTTVEPDPTDPVAYNHIAWRKPIHGGAPEKLCEHCAYMGPGPKPGTILDLDGSPIYISIRDPLKREWPRYLHDSKQDVFRATVSPDRRWIVFNVKRGDQLILYSAPFRDEKLGEQAWTELGPGYMPAFSPEGRMLYFVSARDGKDCIWAQRFDSGTGRLTGQCAAVKYFHAANRSLLPDTDIFRWLSVGRNLIVYPAAEQTGSIWILK